MAAGHAEWIERMRERTVPDVASALGVEASTRAGKWSAQCPACNAQRRHTKTRDKRGAIGLHPSGRGWHCFQCDTSGDALDFVAYVRRGRKLSELSGPSMDDVRDWCCRWLGIDSRPLSALPRPARPPPPRAAPPVKPEAPPKYVPADELAAFWSSCVRVDSVPAVVAWLASEALNAQDAAEYDQARALPVSGTVCAPWASHGGVPWHRGGYLLIVPLYDSTGAWRSLVARNVTGAKPKTVPPGRGMGTRGGFVFACPLARQVLELGARPEWWPVDVPLRVEICEGEKKFLGRTLDNGDAPYAPAVIGVESGSWKPEHAARIPDGTEVLIATDTDPNEAGAKYATTIVQSLWARIRDGRVTVELRDGFYLDLGPPVRVRVRRETETA